MAGATTDFDADEVRGNLRAVMLMGLADDPAQRPVFHFEKGGTYPKRDRAGQPWDFNEAKLPPVTPDKPDVTCGDGDDEIVCSYTIIGRGTQYAEPTPMGPLNRERINFTFLDVDYDKVKGFKTASIGMSTYQYDKTLPPDGLHDLTVWTVVAFAEDVV